MKSLLSASRLLRLLPEVALRREHAQRSLLSSRAILGGTGRVAMLLPPSCNLLAPLQACNNHSSSYLIPTASVSIKCSGDSADGLVEALMSFGASSVSIEDAASNIQAKDDDNGPTPWSSEKRHFWNQCELTALFPPDQDIEKSLTLAFNAVGLKNMLPYKLSEVIHQNWEQQVKDLFRPLQVCDSLWIIPQWSTSPEPSAINVILDPGLAFGTGDHPTTQLCLRWLKQVVKGGEHILDYGTGSGILAITGLKLGAACATGVDIDPVAVRSATHNGSLNGYASDLLQTLIVPSSGDELISDINIEHDVVVANLLLNPLLLLSSRLLHYTKPGGLLGLSGILDTQIDQVCNAYGSHLETMEVQVQDGWACLSGTKRVHQ